MKFGTSDGLDILQRCDSDESRAIGIAGLNLSAAEEKLEIVPLSDHRQFIVVEKIDFEGESEAAVHKMCNDFCSRAKAVVNITVSSN